MLLIKGTRLHTSGTVGLSPGAPGIALVLRAGACGSLKRPGVREASGNTQAPGRAAAAGRRWRGAAERSAVYAVGRLRPPVLRASRMCPAHVGKAELWDTPAQPLPLRLPAPLGPLASPGAAQAPAGGEGRQRRRRRLWLLVNPLPRQHTQHPPASHAQRSPPATPPCPT